MLKDNSYFRVMGPCVKYWERILELLSRPIPQQSFVLLEGFWPSSNWRSNYEHASILIVVDVDLEDLVILPYCSPRSMRHSLSITTYMPFHDLFVIDFVLVWPINPIIYFLWIGRVESDVVKGQKNENYRKVYVQWWVPVRKGTKNDEELYHNYWLSEWKCNHADPKQRVKFFFVAFSFLARSNIIVKSMRCMNDTPPNSSKDPKVGP
jgi:hypothetical protein